MKVLTSYILGVCVAMAATGCSSISRTNEPRLPRFVDPSEARSQGRYFELAASHEEWGSYFYIKGDKSSAARSYDLACITYRQGGHLDQSIQACNRRDTIDRETGGAYSQIKRNQAVEQQRKEQAARDAREQDAIRERQRREQQVRNAPIPSSVPVNSSSASTTITPNDHSITPKWSKSSATF